MASCLRVALCGIGIQAYWNQFSELHPQLEGYPRRVAARLSRPGVELLSLGLIDTLGGAREAGHRCRRADTDLLFIYVTTYALSNKVLPLVQRTAVPVVVLNLQPKAAIDYTEFNRISDRTTMTGAWLDYCSSCPAPEIANVFRRAAIPFHQVTGVLDEEGLWTQIEERLAAAQLKSMLADTNLGLLGHYYNGMLDVSTDVTRVRIAFGAHTEILEVDELSALRRAVSEDETLRRVQEIQDHFAVDPECSESELKRAARTSVALGRLVERHQLNALAYYYKGTGIQEDGPRRPRSYRDC